MARFFYPYRRGYRRNYGRRYRRSFTPYRSWRRYGSNSQSRSLARITIPVESVHYLTFAVGAVTCTTPFIIHPMGYYIAGSGSLPGTDAGSFVFSDLFRAYARLYEEFRVVGVQTTISCTSPIGTSTLPSLELFSAWDRKCTVSDVAVYPSSDELLANGSCRKTVGINNSVVKMSRAVYASDMIEKCTYYDTDWSSKNVTWHGATGASNVVNAWYDAGNNFTGFAPALYVGGRLSVAPTALLTMPFLAQTKFILVFRNPKYGSTGSSKNAEEMREVEPLPYGVASKMAGKSELVDKVDKYMCEGPACGDEYLDQIAERVIAKQDERFEKKNHDPKFLKARGKLARLRKIKMIRALEKELEKDDDTIIDPEEEVLPDDDLLEMDDDDAPTQPIKELENKSSN